MAECDAVAFALDFGIWLYNEHPCCCIVQICTSWTCAHIASISESSRVHAESM